MICQSLFSGQNEKNISLLSATYVSRVVMAKLLPIPLLKASLVCLTFITKTHLFKYIENFNSKN